MEPSQREQALNPYRFNVKKTAEGTHAIVRTNADNKHPPVTLCTFPDESTAITVVLTLRSEYAEGYDKGVGDGYDIGYEEATVHTTVALEESGDVWIGAAGFTNPGQPGGGSS